MKEYRFGSLRRLKASPASPVMRPFPLTGASGTAQEAVAGGQPAMHMNVMPGLWLTPGATLASDNAGGPKGIVNRHADLVEVVRLDTSLSFRTGQGR